MLGRYRDELDVRFVVRELCLLKLLKVTERIQCSVMEGPNPVVWTLCGKATIRRFEGISCVRGIGHIQYGPENRSKANGWLFQES